MPYEISWHLQNRVLDVTFSGEVTEVDLIDSSEDLHSILAQYVAPVHIIYNGIDAAAYPGSMTTIKRALRHFSSQRAMGWLLFAGFSTPETRYVANAFMQVMMRNFKSLLSLEDVDFILQQVDPALQPLLARASA